MTAKDKLEMRIQEGSTKNGNHLGVGGGSSRQQTRMASECGPVHGRWLIRVRLKVKVLFRLRGTHCRWTYVHVTDPGFFRKPLKTHFFRLFFLCLLTVRNADDSVRHP